MGIIYRSIETPDLHRYEREFYPDGTEKHVFCEGARYHVLSYGGADGPRCSEPKCEYNLPVEQQVRLMVDAAVEKHKTGAAK
jgi:hypothetical protein